MTYKRIIQAMEKIDGWTVYFSATGVLVLVWLMLRIFAPQDASAMDGVCGMTLIIGMVLMIKRTLFGRFK